MDPTETIPGFLRMDDYIPARSPGNASQQDTADETHPADERPDTAQCRICLDGPDPDMGRLIRPCLCRGSISVSFGIHDTDSSFGG